MARHKDSYWQLPQELRDWEEVGIAVLMDIRDELQHLNRTLDCEDFQAIPRKLERIARNTSKRKKKKA